MPTIVICKQDKYNICVFKQEKNIIFSLFYFQQAIEISCSAQLSMKKVL